MCLKSLFFCHRHALKKSLTKISIDEQTMSELQLSEHVLKDPNTKGSHPLKQVIQLCCNYLRVPTSNHKYLCIRLHWDGFAIFSNSNNLFVQKENVVEFLFEFWTFEKVWNVGTWWVKTLLNLNFSLKKKG